MKTLLAVSDKIFCVKLASELSKECKKVDTVTSALEAHHYIKSNDYDIIILDLDLPDMDGVQIAQRIIQEDNGIKVVILSYRNEKLILDDVPEGSIIHLTNKDCRKGLISKLKEEKILL